MAGYGSTITNQDRDRQDKLQVVCGEIRTFLSYSKFVPNHPGQRTKLHLIIHQSYKYSPPIITTNRFIGQKTFCKKNNREINYIQQ